MYFSRGLKSAVLAGSCAFLVLGCGGGSSSSTSSTSSTTDTIAGYNGVFVDAAVGGISWSCGDKNGVTKADGSFGACPAGTSVTFSVGNVVLGTTKPTADYIFTPQDVVGVSRETTSDEKVKNMAMLLLSLDADGDPTNGVSITSEILTAFNEVVPASTDLTKLASQGITQKVNETITKIGETNSVLAGNMNMVDAKDAVAHLEATKTDIDNGDVKPPVQPVDQSTN